MSRTRKLLAGDFKREDFRWQGSAPGSDFQLAADTVELWLIDLKDAAQAEERLRDLLSNDEKERAVRFHFESDRQKFSATRGLLRIVLAQYLEVQPREIEFRYAEKGKPALGERFNSGKINFNVSHSGEMALIGITRRNQIGVDIERLGRNADLSAIARRFFSAAEQAELFALPEAAQARAFFRIWTLKEAFIKALGEGLSHPLDQFDVSVDANKPPALETRPDALDAQQWELEVIDCGADYAGALSVSRH
jgi:4'-phosphopantetheinyl transferase